MLKLRLIAPIAELVSETGIREGTAPIIHKESKVAAGRAVYDPLQRWQDWQREPLGLSVASLMLRERELAALGVLLSETDDIGAALPGEQQEGQRKTGLAPDRVTPLELLYLLRSPRVESR